MVKKRKKPSLSQASRRRLATIIEQRGRSLREVAGRIGLRGHASLSRFLRGDGDLAMNTVLALAEELGVEGRFMDKMMGELLPGAGATGLQAAAAAAEPAPTNERSEDRRFFAHPRAPIIYELLKILGTATSRQVQHSLSPALGCNRETVLECLQGLTEMGLVSHSGETWQVVDSRRDFVIPTKYTTELGRRIVVDNIGFQEAFVPLSGHERIMRSVVSTIRCPEGESPLKSLVPGITRLQDDVLARQQPGDDAVVNLYISAVVVGRVKDGEAGARTDRRGEPLTPHAPEPETSI